MLFACKKANTTLCNFNETEKKIEHFALPSQFCIDGITFSYHKQKWLKAKEPLNNKTGYKLNYRKELSKNEICCNRQFYLIKANKTKITVEK